MGRPGSILQRTPNTEVKPKAQFILRQHHDGKGSQASKGMIFSSPGHFKDPNDSVLSQVSPLVVPQQHPNSQQKALQ